MSAISYENIDLFYYHSIDFDFARFFSILNNGIVSQKAASDIGVKHYYRNYTHSSARSEYISVSHFPRTFFSYYKIENELYDFNTHKICFIVDDIDALEKQACFNRARYTNERHVHYQIEPSKIKGILLREIDAKKTLADIVFDYKFTDKAYFENKIFTTISFFLDAFSTFGNTDRIYYLIGKLREAQICGLPDDSIIKLIASEMKNNINEVLSSALGMENPTLLDVIQYFNAGRYPIYIMNRFDIQLAGHELSTSDSRLEQFKHSELSTSRTKQQERVAKKSLELLKKMSDTGQEIYCGYVQGPLTKQDFEISQEIRKLSLKNKL